MKKMKVVWMMLLVLTASLMAKGNGESKSKKVSLDLMYWDITQKPVIDQTIIEYEAENNVKINASVVPWGQYWDKLQTSSVAGTAPDIFWINVPNFPKYSSNNLLLNLQPFIEKDQIDTSVYPKDLVGKYTYKGNLSAIPEQFDTIALAYNKDLFDEAGLSYPDETWDWNDLKEAAIKLTKESNSGKQYGFISSYESQAGYYNFMVMNGGFIISDDWRKSGFDSEGSIEAIQFLVDLMYKYECAPKGAQLMEMASTTDLFTSGKAAMVPVGAWSVPILYESLGNAVNIAPLPKSPRTGERRSIIHGLGWAGYSQTKNKQATWDFLKVLTSKEFSTKIAKAGLTIPSYEGMAEDWVKAIPSMNLNIFIEAQKYSWPYPVSNKTGEWMAVESREIKDIWLGYKSPEEGMKTIAKEMNAILATE